MRPLLAEDVGGGQFPAVAFASDFATALDGPGLDKFGYVGARTNMDLGE